jgi:AcrR family transcriptional regulator
MPRDGSATRKRILESAQEEFLERGFDRASIRSIGQRAGLTSAALYRHFENKEEIFASLVEPGLQAINEWMNDHMSRAYADIEVDKAEEAASRSEVDMMRDVVFPNRTAFKLLLCRSQGTAHENFIHDLVEQQQKDLSRGLVWLKKKGYPVKEPSDETLHMLMSAYITALFEPIAHDYPEEDAMQYYETIERFFLPGWREILGI